MGIISAPTLSNINEEKKNRCEINSNGGMLSSGLAKQCWGAPDRDHRTGLHTGATQSKT